ncbi:MAG TPA: GNAT family N-acetyltransferase [Anaerolineales bacterium]|jgi:streptothricin acetyltransferase|nr:GNAT family N-acetyltransferase [Anaerolineales bacterium]
MDIQIRQLDSQSIHQVDMFDLNSIVSSHLVLQVNDNKITYTVVPVAAYEKMLSIDTEDKIAFIDDPQKAIFFAEVGGKPVGQVKVMPWWNKFAYIEELAVNIEFRGKGVGMALMKHAIEWARMQEFPGMMLETQNNNVPACKLYEKCGFVLGGFDQYAYKNFPESKNEIALYWYLIF